MKWNPKDVEVYLQSKEYVDTAIVPIMPIAFGTEMGQASGMSEFIHLVTLQLERQFKGRMMLLPGFSYLKTEKDEKLISDLSQWDSQLKENGFKHIFYLTSDLFWKNFESRLTGSLIWIPSIPLETMDDSQKMTVIEGQVKQMLNLFTQKWFEKE
jgi:hypothetical protein